MHSIRIARVAAGAVAALLAFAPQPSHAATPPQPGEVVVAVPPDWEGEYRLASDPNARIVLEHTPFVGTMLVRSSQGWGAIGFWDAEHFEGVMRPADLQGTPLPGAMGKLSFDVRADGRIDATLRHRGVERAETWVPERLVSNRLPEYGEYVYVEELPEAIQKVAPKYPPAARKAGIQGTVMVQALVGKDGIVRDTRIVKSIPQLDEAALTALRQWKFKPALSKGRPVAVWVAAPVKFTLK